MVSRNRYKFTSKPDRTLRAMRQTAGTVYHQLLEQGFTPEDIQAAEDSRPGTRHIGLAVAYQDGSDVPMVGVSYGGDFRSEEETGLPQIHVGLKAEEHKQRVFTGEVDGHWYLGIHADRGLRHWRGQVDIDDRAATALRRAADEAQWKSGYRDGLLTVAELRTEIREAGVTGPLPRKKDELRAIHREKVRGGPAFIDVGEFHYGDTLILLPFTPVLTATLRILSESGKHLRMGGSSTPFGRGASLYDDRDLTGDNVEAARANEDYVRRMNKKAEPVRRALRTGGNLYAISPGRRKNGEDYFWLNYSPRGHRQVFGWFTLKQLLEKHATGDWTKAA